MTEEKEGRAKAEGKHKKQEPPRQEKSRSGSERNRKREKSKEEMGKERGREEGEVVEGRQQRSGRSRKSRAEKAGTGARRDAAETGAERTAVGQQDPGRGGHPPRVKDRRMQDRLPHEAQCPSRAKEAGEPARGSCSSNCWGPKNEAGGQAENVPQTKTRMKKFDQVPSESQVETKDIAATSHELRVQSRAKN